MKSIAHVLLIVILVLVSSLAFAAFLEETRKAAEHGNANAQFNLGVMYENGRGVDKDEAKAVEYYSKAAWQGQDDAQFNLGNMYFDGRGVAKDDSKAVAWWQRAAEQGHVEALVVLSALEKKAEEAERLKKAEAEEKAREASIAEGAEHLKKAEAKEIRKAAEQGNVHAQFLLGVRYEGGVGVDKDEAKAVEWYSKAAGQGDVEALAALPALKKKVEEAERLKAEKKAPEARVMEEAERLKAHGATSLIDNFLGIPWAAPKQYVIEHMLSIGFKIINEEYVDNSLTSVTFTGTLDGDLAEIKILLATKEMLLSQATLSIPFRPIVFQKMYNTLCKMYGAPSEDGIVLGLKRSKWEDKEGVIILIDGPSYTVGMWVIRSLFDMFGKH
jgi:hypothetical protein